MNPVCTSPSSASCGKRSSRSLRRACGTTTSSTHCRTAARTARCSSLSARSTQVPFARSRSRPAWAARSAARCSSYVRPAGAPQQRLGGADRCRRGRRAGRQRGRGWRRRAPRRVRRATRARSRGPPRRPPTARWRRSPGRGRTRPGRPAAACRPRSGTSPRLGLPHRQLRVLGEHPQVTGQRELEAGTDRMSLHRRDADDAVVPPPRERLLEAVDGGVQGFVVQQPGEARPARAPRRRRW